MAYTQEQLEKYTNKQLVEIAEKKCSFLKKSALKKSADIIKFILNPPSDKELFQNASMVKLKELGKKHSGFKASDYAKSSSKDKLIEFLISKGEKACKTTTAVATTTTTPVAAAPVVAEKTAVRRAKKRGRPAQVLEGLTKEDIHKMAGKNGNYPRLKRIAADHNWNGTSWKKAELVKFLLPFFPDAPSVEATGRLDVVAGGEEEKKEEEAELDLLEFPVSDEIIAKYSGTVDSLKELLRRNGITTALPRKKDDLISFFKKRRCSDKEFNCNDTEFCDLRNKLCNDLKILHKGDKFPHLANGLGYLSDEGHGRFVGTKEAIAILQKAFAVPPPMEEEEEDVEIVEVVPTQKQPSLVPVKQEQKAADTPPPPPVSASPQDETGISPININRLLDKPSENEIRKAILHCLGLYHDIDKNDEIILTSS